MFMKRILAALLVAAFTLAAGAFSPQAGAAVVRAVEFYHPGIDHLFVTANPQEIDALDTGAVAGWLRTGQRFRVDDAPAAGLVPVCRFYTSAYAGKATHFFTASAGECEQLKTAADWVYEGVAFYTKVPDAAGACGADAVAIHRLYNAGQGGAPNHAYTAYARTREILERSGWVPEGVAFCAPQAAGNPLVNAQMLAGSTWNMPRDESDSPRDDANMSRDVFSEGMTPRLRIQFQTIVRLGAENNNPFELPYPMPAAYVRFQSRGDGFVQGLADWDPVSGSFRMVMGGGDGAGREVIFDDAAGPDVPVCTLHRVVAWVGANPPATQRYPVDLFTGCESGLAHRL